MLFLYRPVIPDIGKSVYQEHGEAPVRVVALRQLVDVVIFSTSAERDRLVVEGLWVGWVHLDRNN